MMMEPSWSEVSALIQSEGDERNVGTQIRRAREERGWSQTELAERVSRVLHPYSEKVSSSIDRVAVWRIENPDAKSGGRRVTIAELIAFAKVFNMTIAELLLPTGAADRQKAWAAVEAAFEALQAVRMATSTYREAVMRVRAFADVDEELSHQIIERRDAVQEAHAESYRKQWERHRHEFTGSPRDDLHAFAEANLTPEVAALIDMTSTKPMNLWAWAQGRTVPAEGA